MRTALSDGHCQSQRPRRACGAGPSLAGWEGKFGTPRVLAGPYRSVAAKQTSPTRSERSSAAPPRLGRARGRRQTEEEPPDSKSFLAVPCGDGPRPARTGCAAIRSREAISARKVVKPCTPPDGTRAAISARSAIKPRTLPDGRRQSQRPRRACGAGPSLAGWEGRFGTTRVSAAPPCSRHHLPPPVASGAPPHVPAFSGAAPVLSTVFHRVTPFSASARRAPLLPCAGGCVHAAPSSPSAESTAPARGRRIARFLRAGRPAPPSPCAGTPPCPFLRRAHALPGAPPLPFLRFGRAFRR